MGIKNLSIDDRPREKLVLKGREALSQAELLAILIGSGNRNKSAIDLAIEILSDNHNNLNKLAKISLKELMKYKGIGQAKGITILAALELSRRKQREKPFENPKILSSKDLYEYMKPHLLNLNHEEFWLILLKRNNEVINAIKISAGGISGTFVDPKIIFKNALDYFSSGIILCHNHPSGNLSPSDADKNLTKKIKDSGKILDLPIIDHIIFTDHGYFSFNDEGLI